MVRRGIDATYCEPCASTSDSLTNNDWRLCPRGVASRESRRLGSKRAIQSGAHRKAATCNVLDTRNRPPLSGATPRRDIREDTQIDARLPGLRVVDRQRSVLDKERGRRACSRRVSRPAGNDRERRRSPSREVAADLLKRLREQDPSFLEQSVLDVLVAMGYGGTEQRATVLGGSGDGGVDGVIDQDPLGLERVYVQAKRYGKDNSVQRPDIQGFVGALHGVGANRGVFITTSRFSSGATEYAKGINTRVVLIDGQRLTELMIKYGVGVQQRQVFTVVEVDEDYFE